MLLYLAKLLVCPCLHLCCYNKILTKISHIGRKELFVLPSLIVLHCRRPTSYEGYTFQGRTMRITIIKQKEQRYKRNTRQKHRTTLRGTFIKYSICPCLFFTGLYTSLQKGRDQATDFINMI